MDAVAGPVLTLCAVNVKAAREALEGIPRSQHDLQEDSQRTPQPVPREVVYKVYKKGKQIFLYKHILL
jgi:hypothetical protein